jgi:hypothetical protein
MIFARNTVTRKISPSILRSVGTKRFFVSNHSSLSSPLCHSPWETTTSYHKSTRWVLSATRRQNSSCVATIDVEDLQCNSDSYATAGRMTTGKSHEESWMINLGRGNVNAWLTGVRSDEWFTGVIPSKCPGKCLKGKVCGLERFITDRFMFITCSQNP